MLMERIIVRLSLLFSVAIATPITIHSNNDPVLLANPNLAVHYLSRENLQRLEDFMGPVDHGKMDSMFFNLYTPERGLENPFVFDTKATAAQLSQAGFNKDRETKVLVHGWNSNAKGWEDSFVKECLSNPELRNKNLICVDWSKLADLINYFAAAQHAVTAGVYVGQLFGQLLVKDLGVDPKDIHLIGHSLGAHFVGQLGRQLAITGNRGKVARVTGLEPAKPWYDITKESNKIQITDGEFVDIVHTNSGGLLDGCLSLPENLGNVDFYPNGGEHQPGCVPPCTPLTCPLTDLIDFIKGGCSHERSVDYYVASLSRDNNGDKDFESHICEDYQHYDEGYCNTKCGEVTCAHMGERLEINALKPTSISTIRNGGYFLKTGSKPPYTM